jgi:hypothetical protein
MKARTLTVLILICWFVLGPAIPKAHGDEWYQGQPGQWQRHGNTWEWRGTHGDEWFQGKRGHWYAEKGGGWYWLGNDGDEYRREPKGWQWKSERHKHHKHYD